MSGVLLHVWSPAACNCEDEKYLSSILGDSAIIFHEIIESYDGETKTVPTNVN